MLDFLLQFFGLLLEVTRAAFERGFIGGFGFGGGGFFLKETANPFAELKIGQEQQADEAQGRINNDCADFAEEAKAVFVTRRLPEGEVAEPAARTHRTDYFMEFSMLAAVIHHVKQAGQSNQQNNCPQQRPAQTLAQVAQNIQQIRHAKRRK